MRRESNFKLCVQALSLNKIYGGTLYPENKSYMIKNMCIGLKQSINHDSQWYNNKLLWVLIIMTKSIFIKKNNRYRIDKLLSKTEI